MIPVFLTKFAAVTMSVFAAERFWFDTYLSDYLVRILTLGKFQNFALLKDRLYEKNKFTAGVAHLLSCRMCLSFHFSFWISLIMYEEEVAAFFDLLHSEILLMFEWNFTNLTTALEWGLVTVARFFVFVFCCCAGYFILDRKNIQ